MTKKVDPSMLFVQAKSLLGIARGPIGFFYYKLSYLKNITRSRCQDHVLSNMTCKNGSFHNAGAIHLNIQTNNEFGNGNDGSRMHGAYINSKFYAKVYFLAT